VNGGGGGGGGEQCSVFQAVPQTEYGIVFSRVWLDITFLKVIYFSLWQNGQS
jgi:hypothetical protein